MSLLLRPLFLGLLLLLLQVFRRSPVISAERSVNLKTLETSPLLYEYHRLTTNDVKRLYYFPRRDSTWKTMNLKKKNQP